MALSADDRERISLGHVMERLVATPEWAALRDWMESRVAQDYYKTVTAPVLTYDGALPVEFAKGTLKGIELTLLQPSLIVAEMRAILEREAQKGEDDGPGNLGRRDPGYEREPDSDGLGNGIDGGEFAP